MKIQPRFKLLLASAFILALMTVWFLHPSDPVVTSFARSRWQQMEVLAKKLECSIPLLVRCYFAAAENGQSKIVASLFEVFRKQVEMERTQRPEHPVFPLQFWQPVFQTFKVYEQFAQWDRALLQRYADDILRSLPTDSVYFGGTDSGYFPIAALRDAADTPKIVVISQSVLAEDPYMIYMRSVYGNRIFIPAPEDSADAIRAYVDRVQQMQPAEPTSIFRGRADVLGAEGAVAALNGFLARRIFEKEGDKRAFFVEENLVFPWMYPHLEPHGLIMKLNRQSLTKLPASVVTTARNYWSAYAARLLADPRFRQNAAAQRAYCKLLTAHAGLYAWRATVAAPELRQPELVDEAEFTFKQALKLCAFNVEGSIRYAELLARLERYAEAIHLVENCSKHSPKDSRVEEALWQLRSLQGLATQETSLRQQLKTNPRNLELSVQLLTTLAKRHKFAEADVILDEIGQHPQLSAMQVKGIVEAYWNQRRQDRAAVVLEEYLCFHPNDAQSWFDLGLLCAHLKQPDRAMDSLEQAIKLDSVLKDSAARNPQFDALRSHPRFRRLMESRNVGLAAEKEQLSIADRIRPVAKGTGFAMDGYFVWCGSVIKVGDQYHMFASRWPMETKFPEGYRQNSEIVRAVASRPEGPYKFAEVVVGKREPDKWDSGMAHNPAVYKVGDTFVLYYNASAIASRYRQIGIATAPSVTGPWTRRDKPLDLGLAADANNPAACFEPDGSVRLFWRTVNLRVIISVARSFEGPYTVANDGVWPAARLEDFFFFKHAGAYHVVCEDNAGSVTGHERWGAHLCSADGVAAWRPTPQPAAYDHTIRWTDGTEFHPVRRERPWFLVEDGKLTHLFNGVYDGERTWNQPVPLVPPMELSSSMTTLSP